MENSTLSTRLKKAMEHSNLSQRKLAELIGVSNSTIHYLETGKIEKSTKLFDIAKACGVDPKWLAMGEGKMLPVKYCCNCGGKCNCNQNLKA